MLAQAEFATYVEDIRRAAEGMDRGPEQWDRLRRRLTLRSRPVRPCEAELRRVYEEATQTATGPD
jgi:hypothetical protein